MNLMPTEKQNSKIKGQNEEGFCFLNCNFDFLYLIFAFV